MDLNGKEILIGLSGGINSMAVLCNLVESGVKPSVVHLFYAHFDEHSPDTFQFFADGVRYARKNFPCVKVKITHNSILQYFKKVKMILHPSRGLCSYQLKIEPINQYAFENDLKIDLVGYVKHELKRRSTAQEKKNKQNLFSLDKIYPIGDFSDEYCFKIVKKHIGWYPFIYSLIYSESDFIEGLCSKKEIGKRIFKHNNCLPCKNMNSNDLKAIKKYYPKYFEQSMKLTNQFNSYYGRNRAEFYTTFGRDLGQESTCIACKF